MYRLPIATLWSGATIFAAIAITDAFYGYAGSSRGLWIGFTFACAVCAVLFHLGGAIITTSSNRNQRLAGDIQGDVDQLRGQVAEVRDLAEAAVTGNEAREATRAELDENETDDRPLATIHQFHFRRSGQDVIAGSRSPNPVDDTEIWQILDNEPDATGHAGAS